MKKIVSRCFFLFCLHFFLCLGQTNDIKTEIKAENVFELSIIKIYPDEFPQVSVVFQAKNKFGQPLWKLNKSEIKVSENNQNCEIVQLKNISKDKLLNIGLVLDHSGSMFDNPTHIELYSKEINNHYRYGTAFPKEYKTALSFAKEGIIEFLDETKSIVSKDSILFIGFSSEVDKVYPLTNEATNIKSFLKDVEAEGGTAFYDALYFTIEKLSNNAEKSVIITLTDGLDGGSKHSKKEVIDLAKDRKISIYTIGLGKADEKILGSIATETNGFYYYTNDPAKLKEIYLNIKKQIKSIYQVDYISPNSENLEKERELHFSFVNDTLTFSNDSSLYTLPSETITYIKEQEKIRTTKNIALGGGAFVILLGIGGFIVYRNRKKNKNGLKLIKVYPNPFVDEITVEYDIPMDSVNTTLRVINGSGYVFYETPIQDKSVGKHKINFGEVYKGIYIVQILDNYSKTTIKIIRE